MKFFLDEEFIEDGKTIDLVSIGIVCEDGAEFYMESADFDEDKASDWVVENVLSHLELPEARRANSVIAERVREFVDLHTPEGHKPEFWGYYADYDWVCLCQLFGTMMELPKGWPMYCRDIKQWADMMGNPKLPPEGKDEHHALADAKWNRVAYHYLRALQEKFNERARF